MCKIAWKEDNRKCGYPAHGVRHPVLEDKNMCLRYSESPLLSLYWPDMLSGLPGKIEGEGWNSRIRLRTIHLRWVYVSLCSTTECWCSWLVSLQGHWPEFFKFSCELWRSPVTRDSIMPILQVWEGGSCKREDDKPLSHWEDYKTNFSEIHVQPCEGPECDSEQPAQIYKGQTVPEQPDHLLREDGWFHWSREEQWLSLIWN